MKSANKLTLVAIATSLFLLACAPLHRLPAQKTSNASPYSVAKSPDERAALRRLTAFLNAAFVGNRGIPDSLQTCEPEGAEGTTDEFLAVAAFRVLGAAVQGDTVEVAAAVTSVVYLRPSSHVADQTVAEQRIRVDTLHWTMVRNGSPPQWRVCKWSHEGFDLTTHGVAYDSLTIWSPAGASWATAIALADSIRHADSEPTLPRERRLK